MSARTVVVGGGLAGLLAARRHLAAGEQVTLLEAAPVLGGAIARTEVAGVEISSGAEAYSTGAGAVDALVASLGLSAQVVEPRAGLASRIVSEAGVHRAPAGSLLGIPARPLGREARTVLGLPGALRAAAEPLLPARLGHRPGASVEQVVSRRLGRRTARRLVAPVVGGVHSADPRTLEFATASPQLHAGLARHGSLVRAVRALRGGSSRTAGTRVHSLSPTMAALPEALAAELRAGGADLRTSAEVTGITDGTAGSAAVPEGARWTVRTAGEELPADRLVLACAPDLAASLLAEADPELAAAIPEAPAATVRLVALVVDAPALDAFPVGTGALVAPGTAGIRAKGLTHASAKWAHVQQAARAAHPEAAGPHVLRLSYGRPGEELPAREGIVAQALADASAILGTELTAQDLLGSAVLDWDRAMRQARPGHREALAALTALLEDRPALELRGSWRAGTGLDAIVRAEAALISPPTDASTEGRPA